MTDLLEQFKVDEVYSHYQKAEGGNPSSLLNTGEASSRVLCPTSGLSCTRKTWSY